VTDFKSLLQLLSTSKVDFILVGGMAAIVHGASRLTQDLDIVYSRARARRRSFSEIGSPIKHKEARRYPAPARPCSGPSCCMSSRVRSVCQSR
jgi:hypothetical protein